ncbi:MAG: right-handed parallel beta-helix repeat-containing protein [Cyclobacteriaceae bacterium]
MILTTTSSALRSVTLVLLLMMWFAQCSAPENTEINVADFYTEQGQDMTPVLSRVLEYAKSKGVKRVVFPKGTYHFYPTYARDYYCTIANNDNGNRRVAFPVIDFSGMEIDGGGSDFVFHGRVMPFLIKNSKEVVLKNFTIDWQVPFALEGKVVDVDAKAHSFDISILTPYEVRDGHLYHCIEYEDSEYERTYGDKFRRAESVCNIIGQNIIWDPNTMAPVFNADKMSGLNYKLLRAEEIRAGIVRIYSPYEELPPVNTIFYSKGEYIANRLCPGIRVVESSNVNLSSVDVYHAGAMGLIAERSEDIFLDRFNIRLEPEGGRYVSTTADATHFTHCKGRIEIRNCTFENMMDDAVNVHGVYMRVKGVIGENTLACETYHPHQKDLIFGKVGETVRIVDKETLQPKTGELILKSVDRLNEKVVILTFNQSIKNIAKQGDGVENLTWSPTVLLENNKVRNNRARGFLIATAGKVEVKNNYFSTQKAGIRLTSDMRLWNESGALSDVLIEGNTFEDCVFGGGGEQSVILIDPEISSPENEKFFHRNITIRNNTFKTFDSAVIFARSVDGLNIIANKVIQTTTYPSIAHRKKQITVETSRQVRIENNVFKTLDGQLIEVSFEINQSQSELTEE